MSADDFHSLHESYDDDDDDDEAVSQWSCVDCGAASPATRTAHTLISSKFGWRLARLQEADGSHRFEWRCPGCWDAYKQREERARAVLQMRIK